jgi:hypothetical protein
MAPNRASSGFLPSARRQRSGVLLNQLYRQIVQRLAPDEIVQFQVGFQSTPFGYLRDQELAHRLRAEASIVRKARNNAIRKWRRHTFLERVLLPRVNCLVCNHPMMGGLNGRNGYVCPDCNYLPFGTLFYACDCGTPISLLGQPKLDGVSLFAQAIAVTRSAIFRCDGCERRVDESRLGSRIFWLGIPWPLEGSIDNRLIAMREAMGRPNKGFTEAEARAWLLEAKENEEVSSPSTLGMLDRWPVRTGLLVALTCIATIVILGMVARFVLDRL